MWIYQAALDRMFAVIKKQVDLPPALCSCSKEQLQSEWDDTIWKINNLARILERDDIDLVEEDCILGKIADLESYLENIDYEWSRHPTPCDPKYSLEWNNDDF
jgi:hypothetical protein